jgi:hypothetical protein
LNNEKALAPLGAVTLWEEKIYVLLIIVITYAIYFLKNISRCMFVKETDCVLCECYTGFYM